MIGPACRATFSIWLLLAVAVRAEEPAAKIQPPSAAPTFESRVRPILKAHCFQCHGEEPELRGNLDLRVARLMLQGGDSGPAIAPGKPADSLLVARIESGEMPQGRKQLSADEIATIRDWIERGAQTAHTEPASAVGADFTAEEKSFWSFQPVRRPQPPRVKAAARVRTPIDAFLLARLERAKLTFSPDADKRTLIRRAYFDLIGLPPPPEAVTEFIADDAPDAWERLIDRLLAMPQYGERWGRHWLDIAGYADSDGYGEKDFTRAYAYKYRDYVVRAFNQDKPFDEFIQEQLAGDELVGAPKDLAADEIEKVVATGFLRMIPDGTADATDQDVARNDVMAETIKVVSTSLLGLSLGCAQCHNHRYEPISQADYYRFRAIFEPAYNWKDWRKPQARLVPLFTAAEKKLGIECVNQLRQLDGQRVKRLMALADQVFELELGRLPAEIREELREVRKVRVVLKRTAKQDQLAKQYPIVDVNVQNVRTHDPVAFQAVTKEFEERAAEIKARQPREDFVQGLTEVPGKLPATYLFIRGDHQQPADEVKPGELSVLARGGDAVIAEKDNSLRTSGRRLAYARHLTNGRHPLTARVLVNRVWLEHFGRGIVATPADFGMHGERPTHPELLDWLASEFVAGGWRLKPLHKQIMMSAAYRQSSRRSDRLDNADAENELLGRMNVRRLEAETIRDSMLSAAGTLNYNMGGPPVPVMPDEVGQIVLGVDTRDSSGRPNGRFIPLGGDLYRRSVYVQIRRTMPLEMLAAFDAPAMTPNCEQRASSTVTPQSLMLLNNSFVLEQSQALAERVQAEVGSDQSGQVRQAWRCVLALEPTESQVAAALEFLAAEQQNFAKQPPIKTTPGKESPPKVDPALRALAALCQALLGCNGFLYVD